MMKRFTLFIVPAGIIALGFAACKSNKPAISYACSQQKFEYARDIQSLIKKNCASTCHSAENRKHNIDLTTYDLVKAEAGQRRFLSTINHVSGFAPMPAGQPRMDNETIQAITCWIEQGMKP